MPKLSLKPDELVVESFATRRAGAPRGTAFAHGDTMQAPDDPFNDPMLATVSCHGTCDDVCNDTRVC